MAGKINLKKLKRRISERKKDVSVVQKFTQGQSLNSVEGLRLANLQATDLAPGARIRRAPGGARIDNAGGAGTKVGGFR